MFRIDGLMVALDDDAAFGLHTDIGLPAQGIGGDAGVIDGEFGFAAALQGRFLLGGRLTLPSAHAGQVLPNGSVSAAAPAAIAMPTDKASGLTKNKRAKVSP